MVEGRRIARGIGVLIGTLAILTPGVYGAVTLLPPLPEPRVVQTAFTEPTEMPPLAVPLPAAGASALVSADGTVLGTGGSPDAVPMAGAAKTVLGLVTLDAHPIADGDGDTVTITADDVTAFAKYSAEGARVTPVTAGSTWTQRELLAAVALGSSNNLSETLARWAFGSVAAYLDAAAAWFDEQGLDSAEVVDATGIAAADVASAADLARIAQLAGTDPVLSTLYAERGVDSSNGRGLQDYAEYRPETGISGISRSYTDAAGVCLLFAMPLPTAEGAEPVTVYVSMLAQDSYPALSAALDGVLAAAPAALVPTEVVAEGAEIARVRTAWGDEATLVADRGLSGSGFAGSLPPATVDVVGGGFVTDGRNVGTAAFDVAGSTQRVALRAEGSIRDPGPGWRLTHPVEMSARVGALFGG
ncbi:D-alanyl-D-alanine carboxypeptidase-like protein [Diaminobutyricimonas aerilata]|uniref:D-alanyl-D-alanine carboxypeptidase-like protein n=1 Tax=Diaminobutyricimonas aerilata TaxID=1162967 RepID=A0A2M9CJ15_9MICO|nr:hypothetical protein [Diaminobutyricimonas aerilata]PJJ71880.1 D-alanyl-D-alanine carboxypeptidase-like protein [Diaminobutyricimonas aerilata]